MKKIYAIFGGNFDPIHYGHIDSAEKLAQKISIEKIIFLPNNQPPHREKTKTSIIDRLKMIKLAIHNHSLFKISYLETKKEKFFYTIDTLIKIRAQIGHLTSLCFIIGEDHLYDFHLWKDWKKILLYTHILIIPRKHKKKNLILKKWIDCHIIHNSFQLHTKSFGFIFFVNIPIINISSSQIRNNYFHGQHSHNLLPLQVNNYIILKKLYCYNK